MKPARLGFRLSFHGALLSSRGSVAGSEGRFEVRLPLAASNPNATFALLSIRVHITDMVANRVDIVELQHEGPVQCEEHEDCRRHPELGVACEAAGSRRLQHVRHGLAQPKMFYGDQVVHRWRPKHVDPLRDGDRLFLAWRATHMWQGTEPEAVRRVGLARAHVDLWISLYVPDDHPDAWDRPD